MNDLPFLLALSFIPKLGPVSGRSLISYCGGTAEAVFATPKGKLLKVPGIGETIAEAILEQETLNRAEEEIGRCEKLGIQSIPYDHPTYPRELTYIFDAPHPLPEGKHQPECAAQYCHCGYAKTY